MKTEPCVWTLYERRHLVAGAFVHVDHFVVEVLESYFRAKQKFDDLRGHWHCGS